MPSYLITGGAGFIGSHLVHKLVSQGQRVRVLDNFSFGKRENLAPVLDKIELIEGDIRDLETCRKTCQGIDYISHQAALGSVQGSIDDPLSNNDVNITGTLNMLVAAREAKVKKLVFASSAAIYGDDPELPKREAMTPKPLSPYALSKLAAETYCRQFFSLYGFETVSLRYFNVFGPRQDPNGPYAAVIPKFCEALIAEKAPVIFGDGGQTRDFCYIDNVVQANLLAMASETRAAGQMYNVACHHVMTLNEMLKTLQDELKRLNPAAKICTPEYRDVRVGDIRESFASIEKAQELLGYSVGSSVEQGLRYTIKYYFEN